ADQVGQRQRVHRSRVVPAHRPVAEGHIDDVVGVQAAGYEYRQAFAGRRVVAVLARGVGRVPVRADAVGGPPAAAAPGHVGPPRPGETGVAVVQQTAGGLREHDGVAGPVGNLGNGALVLEVA